MNNNIYDHRYANGYREHLWGYETARWWAIEHFIGRRFPVQSVANVLDYGAGSGLYVKLWENLFPNAELYFCDPSSVARDKFVGAFPQYAGRYKLISGDEAPFHPESFDLVVSVEVIEHVQKLADYLSDIQRVLRRNGVFFHDSLRKCILYRICLCKAEGTNRKDSRGLQAMEVGRSGSSETTKELRVGKCIDENGVFKCAV